MLRDSIIYEEETCGVRVRVEPRYREDQSSPKDHRYFWSYTVEITNNRKETIRLVERYWRITDVNGHCEVVRGLGVLGESPSLDPGKTYKYTSAAPLDAPSGVMEGAYRMQTASGETFEAVVPAFSLDSPHEPARRRPH